VNRKYPVFIITSEPGAPFYQNFPLREETIIIVPPGQAVCSMMRQEIDLVLLDCGYDVPLGIGLLGDLKKRFPSVPVLFLSEQSSEEILLQVFRKGARDFFKKPPPIFHLQQRITELLRLKRQAKEQRQHLSLEDYEVASLGQLCNIRDDLSPGIMKAVCLIENQFNQDLSLDQLASLANMSKHHFARRFSQEINMSPVRYLKFVRVKRAKDLLKQNKRSVFHTALRVGFKDISTFNRNFKEFVGCSPLQYRNGKK
jgi:AraC-like DNA-binding protein